MSGPLLSPHWYRISGLQPRLRAQVRVQRQKYRNQIWYQLSDAGSGRHHRLNQAAYRFVGCMNGQHTVGEIWDVLVKRNGDEALTQDEAIRVLGQLNSAELLQCELTPDIEAIFRQHREHVRRKRWSELNPLAIRVRLFNPSRWLRAFDPWLELLFRPAAIVLWLAVVLPALLIAAGQWAELRAFAAAHVDTPRYLVIAWLAYPLIKAVHELGHALAVRRWGGTVNDVGFTMFVLVPVPYVDASDASGFTRRSQRAIVSAIGILVELFIAAVALYVWINTQSGLVRDTAFVVMLIASVSTLVFNGNPLLRFDGYHLLCDLLELPNLDTRSKTWWSNLLQQRIFGIDTPALVLAIGERKWMLLYAPLAWAYRLYIGILISFWIGAKSAFLGMVIAVTVVVMLIVMPFVSLSRQVSRSLQGAARQRAIRAAGAGAVVIVLAATLLPLPYGTVCPGVVWLPEKAQVRVEASGFVSEVRVRDGDAVALGQVLALLHDPVLLAKQAEASNRLTALRVQHYNALQIDRVQAQNLTRAVQHAEAELARIDTRVQQLEIRSQVAGRMVMARQDDLPDTFLSKGELLGYVFAPGDLMVRTVVPHEDAALVRERSRLADVRLEAQSGRRIPAELTRESPAATFELPSPALADRNGGAVVTDPADTERRRTLEPVFLVDVALPGPEMQRIGGRAWVRFDFGSEALVFQWTHALRQLFLQHFGAGG
ncbi:MAG: peptidase M50 [Betaproteobacteria bacterium]|nr:peptidase M50 [Betaproteobacteria bacterium]